MTSTLLGLRQLKELSSNQRNAFLASFLGWSLDAFDYFVFVFVIKDVARDFHTDKASVAVATTLTLACRPIGAFLFGYLGDKFGRRIPLVWDIVLYSVIELLSGLSPNLATFFVLRALFGIAMGGEWGLGTSLAMESVPARSRGILSGILQEGYPVGFLLASIAYPFIAPNFGWRWMFFIGVLPAIAALFIRLKVRESEAWSQAREQRTAEKTVLAGRQGSGSITRNLPMFGYMVLLMAAFNFMSHGTQDVYPTFLQIQRKLSPAAVSGILIFANVGAIIGGLVFGGLSQKIGRRKAIIWAALLAIPAIPLWVFSPNLMLLAVGAFMMQVFVQGAWGVVPAHLSELSPPGARSTFTGFSYQLGNLIASVNLPLQFYAAEHWFGGSYSKIMAIGIGLTAIVVALVSFAGKEAKEANLTVDDHP